MEVKKRRPINVVCDEWVKQVTPRKFKFMRVIDELRSEDEHFDS